MGSSKTLLRFLTLGFVLLLAVLVGRSVWLGRRPVDEHECQASDTDYITVGNEEVQRLVKAIRFQTVSSKPGEFNTSALLGLHAFIKEGSHNNRSLAN